MKTYAAYGYYPAEGLIYVYLTPDAFHAEWESEMLKHSAGCRRVGHTPRPHSPKKLIQHLRQVCGAERVELHRESRAFRSRVAAACRD